MQCSRCGLHKTRTNIVRGRGNSGASILVIGEAPGKSEDLLGKACIGESGKLLEQLFNRAGIPLGKCFFTNCILCRPCDKVGGDNREPSTEEIFLCLENVLQDIEILHSLRGVIFAGKIPKKYFSARLKVLSQITIMHPSALLRSGGAACSAYRDNYNLLKEFYVRVS